METFRLKLTILFIFINITFIYGQTALLESTIKIYGTDSTHSAFGDIIEYKDSWYITFRHSDNHVNGKNGIIKVLKSSNLKIWHFFQEFKTEGIDLRDPKFIYNKEENRLYIHFHGSVRNDKSVIKKLDYFSEYSDNRFHKIQNIEVVPSVIGNSYWPWRIISSHNIFYSIGYQTIVENKAYEGKLSILKGKDLKRLDSVNFINLKGFATEGTIRFNNNKAILLIRRERQNCLLGFSNMSFDNIIWKEIMVKPLGGPNFIFLNNKKLFISGREVDSQNKSTNLYIYDIPDNIFSKILTLPSNGDTGYPGMILKDNILHLCYYSSHESKANIYLAKILIDN